MESPYDNLPVQDRSYWYDGEYQPRFRHDATFEHIFLFFDESKSKNYNKAVRLYRRIPERFRIDVPVYSVRIFKYSDYLTIRKKFDRLALMIKNWKSAQFVVNNEICTYYETKHFIEIFDDRLRSAPNRKDLPPIQEE